VQAAQREGSCDGAGTFLGPLGDATTLIALRLTWCLDDGGNPEFWTLIFLPVLETSWTEIGDLDHSLQALMVAADAELARMGAAVNNAGLVRFWKTIGGRRGAGTAELMATPRFLPLSGNPMDGWNYLHAGGLQHRTAPADLVLLDCNAFEKVFADFESIARKMESAGVSRREPMVPFAD
jgi:hypothetical protein